MESIRSVIVEDEPRSRHALKTILEQYCPGVTVEGEADSAERAVREIQQHQPDLVFLDVQLPEANGFSLLETWPQIPFHVVFVTAFEQYALQAIQFAALDYLLKPVQVSDLLRAVDRVRQRHNLSAQQQQLHVLSGNLGERELGKRRLAVSSAREVRFLPLEDIHWLEANSNYTVFHLSDGEQVVASKTLKHYETLLPTNRFLRIHHGCLVNLQQITRYQKGKGGQVELRDKTRLDVAPARKASLLEHLGLG